MQKYLILFICLGWITQTANAQFYRPQVHEFDFQVFSINKLPNVTYQTNKPLDVNFANGLRYRYHLNKTTAFRGGIFYRNAKCEFAPNLTANVFHTELKIGAEQELNLKKMQLYIGIDLIGGNRNLSTTDYKLNTNEYGASGFVGIRYFLSPNLSVALENDVYYLKQSMGNKLAINPPENGLTTYLPSETGFNFTSVSLCLHFKNQKKACACPKHGKKRH